MKSFRQLIQEQIKKNGAALQKAPYIRKSLEDQKPKLTPKDQGLMSLQELIKIRAEENNLRTKQTQTSKQN